MNTGRTINSAFFAVIVMITGFAGHGFYTFQSELRLMDEVTVEDIVWTSTQLELELSRFRQSLMGFQLVNGDVSPDDVNARFDILWSRIAVFQEGSVGERLATYEEEYSVVEDLFDEMKRIDRRIVNLADWDLREGAEIREIFAQYSGPMRKLTRTVTLGEEIRNSDIRRALSAGVNRTVILAGIATGMAFLGLLFLYRQSIRFQQLAEVNRKLASISQRASRAKSKFLTMMSHELRTPMNGVLGLLAVVRQREEVADQIELIGTAEDSAQKMLHLLTDIFDFSALQSEDVGINSKPFEVNLLAQSIGHGMEVQVSEACPKFLMGDIKRLSQVFNHLGQYIVETAGVQSASIEFEHDGYDLLANLSFVYSEEGGSWTPDLILGVDDRDGDKFATDALGPAIARGLVEMMDGHISLNNGTKDTVSVLTSVPALAFEVDKICVNVVTSSDALDTICRAAIRDDRIIIRENSDKREVHMSLIEAGDSNETDYLKTVRDNYPSALLVALTKPLNPEAFDISMELPLNYKKLREIILQKVA